MELKEFNGQQALEIDELEKRNKENNVLRSKVSLLSEENEKLIQDLKTYTDFFGASVLNRVKSEKLLQEKVEKMQQQQEQLL